MTARTVQNPGGVIFDMDGVLVDSYRAHFESWRRAALGHGLEMSETDFARTFGRTSRDIIQRLWPGRFDAAQAERFDAQKESAYREILAERFPEMPGAGALIAALREAGFRLAIGSSGPPENVAAVQRLLPGGRDIEATVTGREVRHGKPDPQVFLLAAQKLGLPPARCAVVEDAPVGLEAARRAGMVAIGLVGTVSREALTPRAHRVIERLEELTPRAIGDLLAANR